MYSETTSLHQQISRANKKNTLPPSISLKDPHSVFLFGLICSASHSRERQKIEYTTHKQVVVVVEEPLGCGMMHDKFLFCFCYGTPTFIKYIIFLFPPHPSSLYSVYALNTEIPTPIIISIHRLFFLSMMV